MASLGQELKQEREKRRISLEEISRATRISLRFLQAIEDDDFELLPGSFFNKAFLRAYLRYLGLDEKAVISRYESLFPQKEALAIKKRFKERGELPGQIPWVKIFLTFFLLTAGLGLLYLVFQMRPKPGPSITRATIVEPAILPPAAIEEEKSVMPPNEINLKIIFRERTWIQVYVDGSIKLDGIKNPGDTFETKATKELLMHLGNAGGITYTLNGFKGKGLGRSGAVVKNIRITHENIKDFLETKSSSNSFLPNSEINHP